MFKKICQYIYNNSDDIINVFGWLSLIAILLAYILNTFLPHLNKIIAIILNIFGSFFMLIICYKKKNWQPTILNFIWLVISIISIILENI